jgi:hypothetical protein
LTSDDRFGREVLTTAAEQYQSQAINMLTHVFGDLNISNCKAAFCLASILVIFAWAFPLVFQTHHTRRYLSSLK